MHKALAVLLSTFLWTSSSAGVVPNAPHGLQIRSATPSPSSSPLPSPSPFSQDDIDDKCTFGLWHKQLFPPGDVPPQSQNYIQINTLIDHTNNITIDVAHLRPATAFNSYAAVSDTRVFAIEGLIHGTNLTIRGTDGNDVLRFESSGLVWTTQGAAEGHEAWCDVGPWDADAKVATTRERKMDCAFPCEKIERAPRSEL